MLEIFELIKQAIDDCSQRKKSFCLPPNVELYIIHHEDNGADGDSWRLEKDDEWLTVEYTSRDGSRTNMTRPDKGMITIRGSVVSGVYSRTWEEGYR